MTKKIKFRYNGKTYIAPRRIVNLAPFAILAAWAGLTAAWMIAVMVVVYW